MKIKHSLFASLLVLSTLSAPHLFAQSIPPAPPVSPEHKAIDDEEKVFLKKMTDQDVKAIPLGDEDLTDGSHPGFYVSGAGVYCTINLKDTVTVKKGEYVYIELSRPITSKAWQLTGNQLTGLKKLVTSHIEISSKTWNDYLDEALVDSSTITSKLESIEDIFFLKATTPGEFTLHFTKDTPTPTQADPKKTSTQSAYFTIEVTE